MRNKLKTFDRVLAAFFGAIVFGVLTPTLYALLIGWPGSFTALGWLAVAGAAGGVVLGVCFSRFFVLVFEFVLEVFSNS